LLPIVFDTVSVYVVVAVSVTVSESFKLTDPIPGAIATLVALRDVHFNFVGPPPIGRLEGVAVNVAVGSGRTATVTVVEYIVLPPGPVNVRTYVVVWVTFTTAEPLSATVPTPKLIEAEVAFVEVQVSVAWPPPIGSEAGL